MDIPSWFLQGTAPQWGVFIIVLLAFLRLIIPWREQNISSLQAMCKSLQERVDGLLTRLDECEIRCEQRDDTILGMKKQNVAQQIGFVRLLMRTLGQDNPELQHMLKTLETMEISLEQPIFLEGNKDEHKS